MQRKVYVTGAAALLAALLAGCSSGSDTGASPDDSKPNDTSTSVPSAPPGKYRTLPEACGQVERGMLDAMVPGLRTIPDEKQREQAYLGTATLTYNTDRRVGCRWTGESPFATDHLVIDFERVVSYDTTVSDDTRARQVFTTKEAAAHLAELPSDGTTKTDAAGAEGTPGDGGGLSPDSAPGLQDAGGGDTCDAPGGGSTGRGGASPGTGAGGAAGARPSRVLSDLGDAAFLTDVCATPSSAARHRTVTVVFRTSNVIVTVQYDEQPSRPTDIPDRVKMQDTAQELAQKLAGQLTG